MDILDSPKASHSLQKKFRPGDTSELRNKYGRCRNCERTRGDGEHFRVCKGCKTVLYCSEECQRAQWPQHRSFCKWQRENDQRLSGLHSKDGMPDVKQCRSLLFDFAEIHHPALHEILHCKISMDFGDTDNFLSEPKVCLVPLKYRKPESGPTSMNPALSLIYSNMMFLPLERVLSESNPNYHFIKNSLDATVASRERTHARMSQLSYDAGSLIVMFSVHGVPIINIAHFPLSRNLKSPDVAKDALELHTKWIELGIVLRIPKENTHAMPGYLKKVGRKWDWRPLLEYSDLYTDPEWRRATTGEAQLELLKRKLATVQQSG